MRELVVFCPHHVRESGKHRFIAGLVEVELHAEIIAFSLYIHQGGRSGENYHHPVLLHVADRGGEIQILKFTTDICREEANRAPVLKIILDLPVFCPFDLDHQLV